jgi:hypothetical protein
MTAGDRDRKPGDDPDRHRTTQDRFSPVSELNRSGELAFADACRITGGMHGRDGGYQSAATGKRGNRRT